MSRTATKFISCEAYKNLVLRSGLVARQELAQAMAEFERDGGNLNDDCRPLSKRLLDAGLISSWQNWHLMRGRSKGFFIGHYKLMEHIATGGMSSVYLAQHIILQRPVALKVLDTDQLNEQTMLKRFYGEMRALAALDHPHIVRVYDCGVAQGKFHYVVLEYVEGSDLHRLVVDRGPLPFEEAADYIRQAAVALAEVHRANMIHRDVKPGNLLLSTKGFVKLLDMGLVRVLKGQEASLTLANKQSLLGTVDYLAPEQAIDSHNVDARVDIYSLGCALYYLLVGKPPFSGDTLAEVLLKHQTTVPESILRTRPDAPRRLVNICEQMIAKQPENRYQTMEEVREHLDECLTEMKLSAGQENVIRDTTLEEQTYPDLATESQLAREMLASADKSSGNYDFLKVWRVIPAGIDVLRWMARAR